jgi:hypothetical protein
LSFLYKIEIILSHIPEGCCKNWKRLSML